MAKDLPEIMLGSPVKDKISYSYGICVWQKKHVDGRWTFGVQPRDEGAVRQPEWEAEESQLVAWDGERYDAESSKF
jgi:hypothetical protein